MLVSFNMPFLGTAIGSLTKLDQQSEATLSTTLKTRELRV